MRDHNLGSSLAIVLLPRLINSINHIIERLSSVEMYTLLKMKNVIGLKKSLEAMIKSL